MVERLEKERQAWQLSARGLSAHEIAPLLGVTARTVERMHQRQRKEYKKRLEAEQDDAVLDAIHRCDAAIHEAWRRLARRNVDSDKSSAVALLSFIGRTEERRNKLRGISPKSTATVNETAEPIQFTFGIDGPRLTGSEDARMDDKPFSMPDAGFVDEVSKPALEEHTAPSVEDGDCVPLKDYYESRSFTGDQ